MNLKSNSSSGYTLVEILVGLTIIGILFSIGFVSFRDFSRRQALSGAGKNIQGDLRIAQEMAIAGQKPDNVACNPPGNTLSGVNFRVTSTDSYKVEAVCTGSINAIEVKSVILPADIQITSPSPNPIFFKVIGAGTGIDAGSSAEIVLTQLGTNNTMTVTITAGGEIK